MSRNLSLEAAVNGGGCGWREWRREEMETTAYQFGALLCRCHSCQVKKKNNRQKRRLPEQFVVHVQMKKNTKSSQICAQTPKQNDAHRAFNSLLSSLAA